MEPIGMGLEGVPPTAKVTTHRAADSRPWPTVWMAMRPREYPNLDALQILKPQLVAMWLGIDPPVATQSPNTRRRRCTFHPCIAVDHRLAKRHQELV